ncbi:MAG: rod shape-determining protein MreC [Pseudonocardiales bacterium]|nr:rod shape-determining protein MreC [Pseudonocardiales bacterium]
MRRLTRRQRVAAIVLAALALGFLTLDLGGGSLRSAHSGVRGALGSLYRGTDAVLGPTRHFIQGIPSAGTSHSRISVLRHENAVLRGKIAATDADRAAHAQVARLQLAATSGGYRIVPARVIALGPGGGFDWTVTLDAGTGSGIRVDQTVTDGTGLVGRVLHADASSCVVLLGADPGSGVGVRDLRTGQVGVATGRGSAGFTFVPLDPKAVIRVGDRLVTGPTGSTSFAAGLSVGTVTAVRTSADGTTTATVRAAVSPTSLDLVGVILVGGQPLPPRPALAPAAQANR